MKTCEIIFIICIHVHFEYKGFSGFTKKGFAVYLAGKEKEKTPRLWMIRMERPLPEEMCVDTRTTDGHVFIKPTENICLDKFLEVKSY